MSNAKKKRNVGRFGLFGNLNSEEQEKKIFNEKVENNKLINLNKLNNNLIFNSPKIFNKLNNGNSTSATHSKIRRINNTSILANKDNNSSLNVASTYPEFCECKDNKLTTNIKDNNSNLNVASACHKVKRINNPFNADNFDNGFDINKRDNFKDNLLKRGVNSQFRSLSLILISASLFLLLVISFNSASALLPLCGNCLTVHPTAGCEASACSRYIGDYYDSYCTDNDWDLNCVGYAADCINTYCVNVTKSYTFQSSLTPQCYGGSGGWCFLYDSDNAACTDTRGLCITMPIPDQGCQNDFCCEEGNPCSSLNSSNCDHVIANFPVFGCLAGSYFPTLAAISRTGNLDVFGSISAANFNATAFLSTYNVTYDAGLSSSVGSSWLSTSGTIYNNTKSVKVGIGTSVPLAGLHVVSNNVSFNASYFYQNVSSNAIAYAGKFESFKDSSGSASLVYLGYFDRNKNYSIYSAKGINYFEDNSFFNESVFIKRGYRLGIGVNSSDEVPVEITIKTNATSNGQASASNFIHIGSNRSIPDFWGYPLINFALPASGASYGTPFFYHLAGGYGILAINAPSSYGKGHLQINASDRITYNLTSFMIQPGVTFMGGSYDANSGRVMACNASAGTAWDTGTECCAYYGMNCFDVFGNDVDTANPQLQGDRGCATQFNIAYKDNVFAAFCGQLSVPL